MKRIIKNTILFALLYLLSSCSDNFLDDNLTPVSVPMGLSNIYISPEWQSSDYKFKLPSLKDADYEIVSKPSWLNIDSDGGHLSDSIAVVKCSAKMNSDFNKVGLYMDFITVKAVGRNYKVPVTYITEGNPILQVPSNQTLNFDSYGNPQLPIQNTGLGILMWNIVSMPNWLTLDVARLESKGVYLFPQSAYAIPFLIKSDQISTGVLTGTIVLVTNDKEHPRVSISVSINLGTPQLSLNTSTVNFSSNETSKSLTFSNNGSGRLVWEFKDIPEWLTISPSSGICNPYTSSANIIFSCDRTKLSPGQNTAFVNLKTNDSSHPSNSITVIAIAPGSNKNIHAIDGIVMDAIFNKNTNTLYYVTTTPNKLVAYDINEKTVLREIELSKAPTCLAISEDWTNAAVGHNGYISSINLLNNTVKATYTLDYSVNDISWCENDWFCYTQKGGSFSSLHWINTADGTLYDDPDKYSLDGGSIIKKVPNQAYIIATRNGTSPSGFFAYDIAKKSKKSYSHMDLTNFWFSEDGDYIFAKNLNIYRTTSSTGSTDTFDADINAIGKINVGSENYYGLQYVYHSNNNLWVIKNESYLSDASTNIYQVEDNDYTLVKKIDYITFYQPDGQINSFNLTANYVFANKEGTEIAVLCKGVSNSSWVIQAITIK